MFKAFSSGKKQKRAEAHDVRGWIRNRNDGTVEAVFEGEEQDVKALMDFSKRDHQGRRYEC